MWPSAFSHRAEQIDQGLIRLERLRGEARGSVLRKSEVSKVVFSSIFPLRKPFEDEDENELQVILFLKQA